MTKRKAKPVSRARARLEALKSSTAGWGGPRPGAGRKKGGASMPRAEQLALPRTRLPLISDELLARARQKVRKPDVAANFNPFAIGEPPPGVLPKGVKGMAFDDSMPQVAQWAAWGGRQVSTLIYEGLTFPGYAYLSEVSQRTEYRVCSETIATEMTRKWMKLKSVAGDDQDKTEKIKQLEDELRRLKTQDAFRELAQQDGFMGVAHLYIDTGDTDDRPELMTSIGNGRDETAKQKVKKGTLKALRVVEPMWVYPSKFNAIDPLAADWYRPTSWYSMGKEIHESRLLTIIGREVPDMLKPSYFFGGLSLSQLIKPYVDNWIRTRQSVSDLLHAFSVWVLETDLGTQLSPSGDDLFRRLDLFNSIKDNRGVMAVNQGSEKLTNVSAPLGTLDQLQAQSQEHIASAARIPLVKYTGIEPHGLNASSEGSIKTFDDVVAAYQSRLFDEPLRRVMAFAMLNIWGEVDEDIVHEWNPLRALDPKELAERQKIKAETGQILVDSGIVSQEEERERIAKDPESGYEALVVEDVPDLAAEEEEGLQPKGGKPPGEGGEGGEGGGRDAVLPFVGDAASWSEGDHPRGQPGNAGQFGPGGGGGHGTPHAPQFGVQHGHFTATSSSSPAPPARRGNFGAPIDPSKMTKVGAQMGSNPGGVYEGEGGKRFYVKKGKSREHVRNELLAASLYDLAGSPTLQYRPTPDGEYVATEMEKLDKDNAAQLSPEELREAQADFAVHAWLANWDAAGLTGDNIGTIKGTPTSLDLGGALEFRAQGGPKGKAFGDQVGELDTLRDPKMNAPSATMFGSMTPAQMRGSARYVTAIPDQKIRDRVARIGADPALAEKLIARKNDIARRARMFGAEGDPAKPGGVMVVPAGEAPPVKALGGVAFKPWQPPEDWAAVDGQAEIEEPEFQVPQGKQAASGVIMREKDGRVWIVQPRGAYGGYEGTFPKGRVDEGLSLQANAIKEGFEESGLKARITGHAGDFEGDDTMTRFYYAEREGGDPGTHEDESEGVVLAPAAKLPGFVNRARDQKIAAGLAGDEAHFEESKHPRGAGGKFAEVAGGGEPPDDDPDHGEDPLEALKLGEHAQTNKQPPAPGAPKKTAFGGLWKTGGDNPAANFHVNAAHVLSKPANQGQSYRQMLAFMVKEAPKHGHGALVMPLKQKLLDAWQKAGEKLFADGNVAEATKIHKKLEQLEKEFDLKSPQPANTPPPKPAAQKTAPPPPVVPKPPPPLPAPTEAEMTKAKKSAPLQLQYLGIPDAPDTPAVQILLKEFNAKYAGKDLGTVPALTQKVNDFKKLQQQVAAIAGPEKAKALETQKKQQAAAEAKAVKEAAAEAAKFSDPATKAHYEVLAAITGGGKEAKSYLNSAEVRIKNAGLTGKIEPREAAMILAYTGSHYGDVNRQLRSGSITEQQYKYAKALNAALDKLPPHVGTTYRKADLPPEVAKLYKPGYIVPERGFTSSSKTKGTWSGSYHYTIEGKSGRDVVKLSSHASEDEVVFKANSHFMVVKTMGHEIFLREVD